ncbi:MAG: hypothetical protein DRN15_08915 [Thermoprotei archaeon]|nr:MAG: hypothetical protein DRM97_06475 [Thermoprotei archaeon]RLF22474.1 MAG: hypothetical protein DRN15_08915 [Thermoprotei archaeon]
MKPEVHEIDLRVRAKGCTQSPIIKLSQLLTKIEQGGVLKVTADERDVPYKVLALLTKKRGLVIRMLARENHTYVVMIGKSENFSTLEESLLR